MNASEWIKRHPWAFGLGLALGLCLLVELVLLLHLRGLRAESLRHEARATDMGRLADKYRSLKAQSGAAGRTLPPGVRLAPDVVNRIATERRIAGNISVVSASPVRHDDRVQEQVINLTLTRVTPRDLSEFLRAVEAIDPAVRTRELRMTPSAPEAVSGARGAEAKPSGLVDARVQISAYETIASTK